MKDNELKRLRECADAMNSGSVYMAAKITMASLTKAGLVEFNEAIVEGNKIAFRPTAAGLTALQNEVNNEGKATMTEAQTSNELPSVTIDEEIIPITPARRAGAGRPSRLPFATISVNQSFFVPDDGNKDHAKRIATATSQANRRFKDEGRKFTSRAQYADEHGGIYTGVRVWRTA